MVLFKRKDNKNGGKKPSVGNPEMDLGALPALALVRRSMRNLQSFLGEDEPELGWRVPEPVCFTVLSLLLCQVQCAQQTGLPERRGRSCRLVGVQVPEWSTHPSKESELVGVKTFSFRQNTFWKLFVKTIKHLQWSKI